MRIVRCSAAHYRVPREVWWGSQRIGASQYEISHLELVTFEVETDEGVAGSGFTYTVGHGGAAVLALLETEIAPALLQQECREVEALWHRLHAQLHFVGNSGVTAVAIAAADIAVWDALSRAAGLPLYRFLGAHRSEIPAYASGVNLAYSIDELLHQVEGFRERGFIHVHLICAVPHGLNLEYLPIFERLLEEPLEIRGGLARPKEVAGHGMIFSREVLEPYRIGRDGAAQAREVSVGRSHD